MIVKNLDLYTLDQWTDLLRNINPLEAFTTTAVEAKQIGLSNNMRAVGVRNYSSTFTGIIQPTNQLYCFGPRLGVDDFLSQKWATYFIGSMYIQALASDPVGADTFVFLRTVGYAGNNLGNSLDQLDVPIVNPASGDSREGFFKYIEDCNFQSIFIERNIVAGADIALNLKFSGYAVDFEV